MWQVDLGHTDHGVASNQGRKSFLAECLGPSRPLVQMYLDRIEAAPCWPNPNPRS